MKSKTELALVSSLIGLTFLTALSACEMKGESNESSRDEIYRAAEEAAPYIKHYCDKFGRAIYADSGVGIFVIDQAPECAKDKKSVVDSSDTDERIQ